MKQRIIALLTTGLLILSLAGCAAQNTTAQTLPESVTAGGSGKATAAADIAQLTLGVETEGATTEAAREKNAEAVQAAVDFLTGMGVAESDIKTERIYLGEQYDGGYQMSTRMTVLVREVDRAGEEAGDYNGDQRHAAAAVADKGAGEVYELGGDACLIHDVAAEDEEGDGQQHELARGRVEVGGDGQEGQALVEDDGEARDAEREGYGHIHEQEQEEYAEEYEGGHQAISSFP